MNFKKFINSDYLKNNPLCGINTYKDELNLATGACTRPIKKLVLDGTENWDDVNLGYASAYFRLKIGEFETDIQNLCLCTHFEQTIINTSTTNVGCNIICSSTLNYDVLAIRPNVITTLSDFTSWLSTQYANGTPVTVWYVLATPTAETITVPSGLSGTEEGYLNQSGTPTPTNPIYPTANTVEKWFDINHYIMGTDTDTLTTLPAVLYPNAVTATVGLKGDMSQSSQPSPQTPIQPSECGDLETTGEHTGQYKIPILSNSTTTPVYLGEVQSTRRIKKLVLDGSENWDVVGMQNIYGISVSNSPIAAYTAQICTHYTAGSSWNDVVSNDNRFGISSPQNQLVVHYNSAGSTTNFKAYLAQQYANGTPVTVWYVLLEPTTGIVNEPLRKIGTYADKVSGITIPTTAGTNTIDVQTALKPSEVSVTYHGWHPVSAVHERENGAWD